METDEDQYSLLVELVNMNATYDPSDVDSESFKHCRKSSVNDFGSKFNPAFCYVNFLLSYLGNGLVLYIIYKYEKLNTVTNIFLLNLVLSNILFATSLPFWATYHLSEWIFGNVLCKLVSSAYFIGFYSSILFLTLMTFDRYLAVVHAVAAAKSRKRSYAIISSAAVCITVRILSTRMKEKCRAVKLIFVIVFTFFVCWTPYNVVVLLRAIQSTSPDVECADSDELDYALFVTQNIAYLYCCISPVFYTFVGKKFQSHFKRLLAKKIPCLRRHISLSSHSTRSTSQKTPHSDHEY
ncbi:C-C chemokine receptor type 4-like isoform X2 [Phycodurus eques]|uniref:C-C chemokine receptor type 4-like isoform X2 n=1 Tax=Phycodurus eques TaxID=693459 RepID=UPI002ACE871E|nr:C-C chemokine receptor type 4-like isoform X2 [Phycodurus eques]